MDDNKRGRGRPRTVNPRKYMFRLRMNRDEKALLDEASIITGLSTSDVLREGVKKIVDDERRRGIDILDY